MAESSVFFVPETDFMALKGALYAQQQLLLRLYNDLEMEREASASAASEALSMILRLQGEKASLKMEASQYKRMAEEKMCHAEEALELFEDAIYQREMEIASLELQVQAYRYRLLSMGINELGVHENKYPENLLMQRNDNLLEEKGVNSNMRRLNSLPVGSIKDCNLNKTTVERKGPVIPVPGLFTSLEDENESPGYSESENKSGSYAVGEINSYQKQIKRLNGLVKYSSDDKDASRCKSTLGKGGTMPPLSFSPEITGTKDSAGDLDIDIVNPIKGVIVDPDYPSSSQDIYEVPEMGKSCKFAEPQKCECLKLTVEDTRKLRKPFPSQDTIELTKEKDADQVKTILDSTSHERESPRRREGLSVGCNASVVPTVGVGDSQAGYQLLTQRTEHLERAKNNDRHKITAGGEEELKLLKEISEQLKLMESGMRSLTAKKSPPLERPSLDPLQEAMIYFWL